MFESVPYLKRGNVRVIGPQDLWLELSLVAIQVEYQLRLKPEVLEQFMRLYEDVMPEATRAGQRLHRSGVLHNMSKEQAPASAVMQVVRREVGSAA